MEQEENRYERAEGVNRFNIGTFVQLEAGSWCPGAFETAKSLIQSAVSLNQTPCDQAKRRLQNVHQRRLQRAQVSTFGVGRARQNTGSNSQADLEWAIIKAQTTQVYLLGMLDSPLPSIHSAVD